MSNSLTLRKIAEKYRIYYAVRGTKATGLQGPVLIVFESNQIWWKDVPSIIDSVPTVGAAAGRIKEIASRIDPGEWALREGETDVDGAPARRLGIVNRHNHDIWAAKLAKK